MIRLLIVDRSQLMRDVMMIVLQNERDLHIIGFASTVEEALVQANGCDMVLVSANLPNGLACDVISAVAQRWPEVKVVAIDVNVGRAGISPYLAAGASGCVFEDDSVDRMLRKVRALCNGRPAPLAER